MTDNKGGKVEAASRPGETQEQIETKREYIASQFREAMSDPPVVTCECKRRIPLRMMFKCLYCMCYFCQACAEIHFGKSRKQYYAEKEAGAPTPLSEPASGELPVTYKLPTPNPQGEAR